MNSRLAATKPPSILPEAHASVEQLRQELAEQQQLNRILAQNPNPIYRLRADGQLLYANPAAERLQKETGANADKMRPAVLAWVAESLRTGAEFRQDFAVAERHFSICVVPDVAASEATLYLTEITDLKQAREAAEAAATARANFLANMSHEIRTPLNGVLGITAQLAKTPLDVRQRELLQIVQTSGQHLLGVINNVLDMAKITSGQLELVHEPFDVCELLFRAAQPLFAQAQEKGIDVEAIRLHESCPNPRVLGDAHRLSQVILNLFSNAIKFTPAGGRITAGGYQAAETDDSLTIVFRFSDTGVGIAPDKLEHIFESFTQAYADTSRQYGGTGLGLSISRALVKQMGGELTVESILGEGSTFTFTVTLPKAASPTPALIDSPAAASFTALRGRRLLLVEDDEINRLVAGLLLEEWGIAYDEAEDGPAGIALAATQAYDVVLMDIQMPRMNGLEATTAIRALPDPARANVPIIALTANAFEADRQQCLAVGMQACVAKPFDETVLYQTLLEVLAAG